MRIGIMVLAAIFVTGFPMTISAETLRFEEMYTIGVRGLKFTPKLVSLAGKEVSIVGFMAPPLRAAGDFFVLTKDTVSLCPFCQSDADWPADILVVYLKQGGSFLQKNRPLFVTGRLELGSMTDPATGFVSQVRLVGAEYREN